MKHFLIYSFLIILSTSFKRPYPENPNLSLSVKIISRIGKNLSVWVTLTNNTADTVRYVRWMCPWQGNYLINNDKWKIQKDICWKNTTETISIPPYQSETKILELEKIKGISKSKNAEFRIGFYYNPPPVELIIIPDSMKKIPSKNFVVWSNKTNLNFFAGENQLYR